MNRTVVTRGAAAMVGPLVLLVVPKCPLCLLPVLAAVGVAVPPAPVLDALVAAVVVAWTIALVRVAATRTLRVAGVIAGSIVIAGRLAAMPVVSWAGVAIMLAIDLLRLISRERVCARACPPVNRHCER